MPNDRIPAARSAGLVLGAILALVPLAPMAAGAEAEGLTLGKPWIRMIVSSRPAAGYFDLTNNTGTTAVLTGAESPGCSSLMLHRSVTQGGQAQMEMVKSVDVAPHGTLIFAPGGYHLMCMNPTDAVQPGKTVKVTLKFGNGTSLTGDFEVKNAAGN